MRLPATFIPVAEQTGIIADIGDWVIAEVASMASEWQSQGIKRRISFNVSPRQLDRHDFLPRMRTAFADAGAGLRTQERRLPPRHR